MWTWICVCFRFKQWSVWPFCIWGFSICQLKDRFTFCTKYLPSLFVPYCQLIAQYKLVHLRKWLIVSRVNLDRIPSLISHSTIGVDVECNQFSSSKLCSDLQTGKRFSLPPFLSFCLLLARIWIVMTPIIAPRNTDWHIVGGRRLCVHWFTRTNLRHYFLVFDRVLLLLHDGGCALNGTYLYL